MEYFISLFFSNSIQELFQTFHSPLFEANIKKWVSLLEPTQYWKRNLQLDPYWLDKNYFYIIDCWLTCELFQLNYVWILDLSTADLRFCCYKNSSFKP